MLLTFRYGNGPYDDIRWCHIINNFSLVLMEEVVNEMIMNQTVVTDPTPLHHDDSFHHLGRALEKHGAALAVSGE